MFHGSFSLAGHCLDTIDCDTRCSVHMRIKLPVKLTAEQREILEDYARLEKDTPGIGQGCRTVFQITILKNLLFENVFRI